MIAQRRARGEVHLLGPGHPDADVAVPVRGDGPAGNHTPGNVNNLTGQVLVHQNLPPLNTPRATASGDTMRLAA
jgi:hypothetical protein